MMKRNLLCSVQVYIGHSSPTHRHCERRAPLLGSKARCCNPVIKVFAKRLYKKVILSLRDLFNWVAVPGFASKGKHAARNDGTSGENTPLKLHTAYLLLLFVLSPSLDAHKIIPLKRMTYEVQNFTPTADVRGIGEFRGLVEGKIYGENLRVTEGSDSPIVLKNLDDDTVKRAREKIPLFKIALNIGDGYYEANYSTAGQEKLVFKDCILSGNGFTLFLNKNITTDRHNFTQCLKVALRPQNAISISHAEISPANDVQVNEGIMIKVGDSFQCLSSLIKESLDTNNSSKLFTYENDGFCSINSFDFSVFMAAEFASQVVCKCPPEIFFLLEKDAGYPRFIIKVYFLVGSSLFQMSCMYPKWPDEAKVTYEPSGTSGYVIFSIDRPENFDWTKDFQPLLFKVEGAGHFSTSKN